MFPDPENPYMPNLQLVIDQEGAEVKLMTEKPWVAVWRRPGGWRAESEAGIVFPDPENPYIPNLEVVIDREGAEVKLMTEKPWPHKY